MFRIRHRSKSLNAYIECVKYHAYSCIHIAQQLLNLYNHHSICIYIYIFIYLFITYLYNIVPPVILLLQAIISHRGKPSPSSHWSSARTPAASRSRHGIIVPWQGRCQGVAPRKGGQIWDRSDFCIDRICIHTHTEIYLYMHIHVYIYIYIIIILL